MSKTALGLTSWVTSGKSFPCFLISKTGPHHISIVGLPRRVSARWGGRSRTAQHCLPQGCHRGRGWHDPTAQLKAVAPAGCVRLLPVGVGCLEPILIGHDDLVAELAARVGLLLTRSPSRLVLTVLLRFFYLHYSEHLPSVKHLGGTAGGAGKIPPAPGPPCSPQP